MKVQDFRRMQGFTDTVLNLVYIQYSPRIWILFYISIVIPTENWHGCTNFYTSILARICIYTLAHEVVNLKLYKFGCLLPKIWYIAKQQYSSHKLLFILH